MDMTKASQPEDAVRRMPHLVDSQDRLQRLQESLVEAEQEIERGEGEEWSPALMRRLIRQGDEMYSKGIQPDPDVCPK
jgi:hypothetical protein